MNKILTILSLIILLSGCASYRIKLKPECRAQKVLYTDLTQNYFNRIYITPNGKNCMENTG
jgi:uncharacterized protein YceK